jgi:hypothetical protein
MGTGVTSPVEVPSPQDFAEIFNFIGGYRISQAICAASEVTPKFVSPSDPAAQWTGAMRGPAFFA